MPLILDYHFTIQIYCSLKQSSFHSYNIQSARWNYEPALCGTFKQSWLRNFNCTSGNNLGCHYWTKSGCGRTHYVLIHIPVSSIVPPALFAKFICTKVKKWLKSINSFCKSRFKLVYCVLYVLGFEWNLYEKKCSFFFFHRETIFLKITKFLCITFQKKR